MKIEDAKKRFMTWFRMEMARDDSDATSDILKFAQYMI